MTETLSGRCLCGAVTITVSGDHQTEVGACHCRMCQRWSGGLFLVFGAPAASVTVTGAVERFASSPFAERAFCPACGSHLWFRETSGPDAEYELMPGLFDGAQGFPLRSEIYTDRAPAFVQLEGRHKRLTGAEYEAKSPHVDGDAP